MEEETKKKRQKDVFSSASDNERLFLKMKCNNDTFKEAFCGTQKARTRCLTSWHDILGKFPSITDAATVAASSRIPACD